MNDLVAVMLVGLAAALDAVIIVYGMRAAQRAHGALRQVAVLLIIGATLLALRTLLHAARLVTGAGLQAHFAEHLAIFAGVIALAAASWKMHTLVRGAQ